MWISESWWSWKIDTSTELFWNCFFVHFFQYYKCLLYRGHLYWSVFRAGKYWVEFSCFVLDISLAEEKMLKSIASILLHDWLTLPGWPITCPPIPAPPPGRNTVHWDYFSVNTSDVLQSHALKHWHPTKFLTSFWQVFDPVWNRPIRLSEQVWTRYKKHCMFVCQISKLEVDRSLQECSQERIGDK